MLTVIKRDRDKCWVRLWKMQNEFAPTSRESTELHSCISVDKIKLNKFPVPTW